MAAPISPTAPLAQPIHEQAARQRRLRLLARIDCATLEQAWQALPEQPGYRSLKQAETGLVMIRARAGGVGRRFNFGEMTATRCVVALEPGGAMGVGYVQGRDRRKAELVALFDAMAQEPQWAALVERDLVEPAEQRLQAKRQLRAAKVAATKVDFFTLVRGED